MSFNKKYKTNSKKDFYVDIYHVIRVIGRGFRNMDCL